MNINKDLNNYFFSKTLGIGEIILFYKYLQSKKIGHFENEKVDIQFKRDTIINMENLLQTLTSSKNMYDHASLITKTKEALEFLQKNGKERIEFVNEMSEATRKNNKNKSLNKEQKNNMENAQRLSR